MAMNHADALREISQSLRRAQYLLDEIDKQRQAIQRIDQHPIRPIELRALRAMMERIDRQRLALTGEGDRNGHASPTDAAPGVLQEMRMRHAP